MSAHTPGPWNVLGEQGCAVWHENEIIATAEGARSHNKLAHANARLIAAAPDLLQALDDLLLCIEVDALIPESVSFMRQARAAILKATGAENKEVA